MLNHYLSDTSLLDLMNVKRETKKSKRIALVSDFIKNNGYGRETLLEIQGIDAELFPSSTTVSFAINDSISIGELLYEDVSIKEDQLILDEVMISLNYEENEKITPLLKEVHKLGHTHIDFVQLKVALNKRLELKEENLLSI